MSPGLGGLEVFVNMLELGVAATRLIVPLRCCTAGDRRDPSVRVEDDGRMPPLTAVLLPGAGILGLLLAARLTLQLWPMKIRNSV